jgi:hypothetical protein
MTRASIYFRGDDLYVVSSVNDVFGIGHDGALRLQLRQPVSPRELGEAVLAALAAYREGVPGRPYVRGAKRPPDPFLLSTGFKSWKAFEDGAKYFSVSEKDGHTEIIPTSAAPKGGYLFHPDRAVFCLSNAEEIGRCLLDQGSRPD